jgi:AmiR/NasT family two-component response regulator
VQWLNCEEAVVDKKIVATPPYVGHGDERRRADVQDAIRGAIEVLQVKHEVRTASAYTILVQASVDGHMSIRDTAVSILEASSKPKSPTPVPAEDQHAVEAPGPREVVGQAIAILMCRHAVTRDAAFEMLIRGSSASNEEVRVIAAGIVRRAGA